MSEIIPAIIGILIALPFCVIAVRRFQAHTKEEKGFSEEIVQLKDTPLQVPAHMKQSLTRFSVHDASDLRRLGTTELKDLLSCSARVLEVFENRLEQIADMYDRVDSHIGNAANAIGGDWMKFTPLSAMQAKKTAERKTKHVKDELEVQTRHVMSAMDNELANVESVLGVIPDKYRSSIILDMMCGYIADGEVDSWEGCIRAFKEDAYRMQQNQQFNSMLSCLERIDENTATAAFFSKLTAWNTGIIASRL